MLIEMDTIQPTPAVQKPRYFTVMSSLPKDLNREQALSLLSSVSQVTSLNILKIHRQGLPVHRIGLVEVEDSESLFRLTSRQFLVRHNQAVKHKAISPRAKIVQHFINKDITLKLNFFSSERGVSRAVTDFFERFGELCVVSIKAHAGHHELTFKVSRDFSIRQYTTDLLLRVGDVDVQIEYPEDDINFDYYEQDLELLLEIQNSIDFGAPTAEPPAFFNPTSAASSPALSIKAPKTVWFMDKEYSIDQEEDCFSDDEETEEHLAEDRQEREETYSPSTSIVSESSRYGIDYFSKTNSRKALSRLAATWLSGGTDTELEDRLKLDYKNNNNNSKNSLQAVSATETCRVNHAPGHGVESYVAEESKGTVESVIKRPKRRRHRKTAAGFLKLGKIADNIHSEEATTQPPEEGCCQADLEEAELEPMIPAEPKTVKDGSVLLSLIWPDCDDFEALNRSIMPDIHAKWRRFVDIKDSMRRERYDEYLRQRALEPPLNPPAPLIL